MSRALPGVAIACAAIVLLVVLSSSDVRRTGSNEVAAAGGGLRLAPGERACQPEEIPPGTAAVAISSSPPAADGDSTPRIAVAVREPGGPVAAGSTSASAPDGRPLAELAPAPAAGAARVCLRNRSAGPVALPASGGVVALDYFSADEAWWSAAPAIAERFGFGKAGAIGAWAFWLALALVAGAWIAGWRAFAGAGARP